MKTMIHKRRNTVKKGGPYIEGPFTNMFLCKRLTFLFSGLNDFTISLIYSVIHTFGLFTFDSFGLSYIR